MGRIPLLKLKGLVQFAEFCLMVLKLIILKCSLLDNASDLMALSNALKALEAKVNRGRVLKLLV